MLFESLVCIKENNKLPFILDEHYEAIYITLRGEDAYRVYYKENKFKIIMDSEILKYFRFFYPAVYNSRFIKKKRK